MAGRAVLASLALVATLAAGVGYAGADHGGCPPFERLRYDYTVEFHHGGDLYSTVHVVGYTVFRFCFEARDQVTDEEIRWESRGGEYILRLQGEEIDETHVLREGQNATAWYDHGAIDTVQIVGLSAKAQPIVVPAEPPPAIEAIRDLLPRG